MNKNISSEISEQEFFPPDLEMTAEKARQIFKEILETSSELKKNGQSQELFEYAYKVYRQYFSFSPSPFNYLALQEHFETLIQINKVKELRGIIGQNGVDELVYRLTKPSSKEKSVYKEEVFSFIKLLLNKNGLGKVDVLLQLQTVAASSLVYDFSETLYETILLFLEQEDKNDSFIIATLKRRLFDRLQKESDTPTMGIVTTLQNTHRAIMFENLFTKEEELLSTQIVNKVSFLGAKIIYVIQISSDHYGLYDSRSQLSGVISKKIIDKYMSSEENHSEIPFIDIYNKSYFSSLGLNADFVEALKVLEDPYFRTKIDELFGISLKDIDLRVQVSVLKFLAEKPIDEVNLTAKEIKSFDTKEARSNAFKVLLAHENFEFIEGIMYLYNQIPEIAIPLYEKYAVMISDLDEVTSFLTENFKNEYEKNVVLKIREGLIQKASEILSEYSAQVHTLVDMEEFADGLELGASGIDTKENLHYVEANSNISSLKLSILTDIEKVNKDTLLLLSAFRSLIKGNPAVSIEDIRNSRMQSYSAEEMRSSTMQEAVEKMRSIYSSNVTNEAIRSALLAKFDARIADLENTSEFDILYFKNELLAFIVFTKEGDSFYASGLNVSPTMQGSGIGEVMMRETIIQKTKTADVRGEVIATKDVVRRYLRDGAVMFNTETKHGEVGMKILWSKENAQYKTKNVSGKTDDEIYEEVKTLKNSSDIEIQDAEDQSKIDFNLTNKGYVITHILRLSNGTVSAIFEKSHTKTTI